MLGEFENDAYDFAENRVYTGVLYFYYYLSTFLFVIHLLNMLIAIMGEAFAENNKIKQRQKIQSHLKLVLDNLWMTDVIKDSSRVKYLIVSFTSQEEDEDEDQLSTIAQKTHEMGNYIKKEMDNQSKTLMNMRTRIENIANSLY